MINRVVRFVEKNAVIGLALVAAFGLSVMSLAPAHAADPTDAAGLVTATSGVLTAFPILTLVVTATAIVGIALFIVRRAKSASR